MNVSEFSALKIGDKIANVHTQSTGEVTGTSDSGVHVRCKVEDLPPPSRASHSS